MKLIYLTVFTFLILTSNAQDVNADISSAKSSYASKEYVDSRKSLQKALINIEKEIAKEILNALPMNMGSMTADVSKDAAGGNVMTVGLALSRYYGKEDEKYAEINIADDSPMIAIVNTFLSNPLLSGIASMANGQKQVNIDGHKGMLQKEEGEEGNYTIMIPFGSSMIIFETNIQDESEVTSMASTIPVSKIIEIVK